MPAFVGIGLAVAVWALGRWVGFDRDRAFYPVILTVIASYYVLFVVMAGDKAELLIELLVFALFAGAATLGFLTSLWIVVAGLAMHGVFDFVHGFLLAGTGVPPWWPSFCLAYDLAAALGLAAILLVRGRSANHRYEKA